MPQIMIYCANCLRRLLVNPSCNKRNCLRCNHKKAVKLTRKYERVAKRLFEESRSKRNGKYLRFIMLSGYRVAREQIGLEVRQFGNLAERFLKQQYPDGGILTIEHVLEHKMINRTESLDGTFCTFDWKSEYYIHGHAVTFGYFKNKMQFEETWGEQLLQANKISKVDFEAVPKRALERNNLPAGVTLDQAKEVKGGRLTFLDTVESARGSLNYIFGYITKGVPLEDWELEALKRTKYIRSWGAFYKQKEPTFDMICKDCGGKCYVVWNDDYLPDCPYEDAMLRIKLEHRPPP